MLSLPIELQCLSVLSSSVDRWKSFELFPESKDLLADFSPINTFRTHIDHNQSTVSFHWLSLGSTLCIFPFDGLITKYFGGTVTFSNLKILSLDVPEWNDLSRLLPLLHTSTLQILDLDITRSYRSFIIENEAPASGTAYIFIRMC